jgi:uncharacterized integral membrane protein
MIIVLFIITFSMSNAVPVRVNYYDFVDFTIPLYLIIFVSFGTGLIFAGLVGAGDRFRLSRKVKKLNKRIMEQAIRQSEVEQSSDSSIESIPEIKE